MPRRKPALPASTHLRRSIAGAAARLMAEEGISDYGAAKRKAARSLGASGDEALPSNGEIEAELRSWQSLFQEDEQRERLQEMRRTALDIMGLLGDFRCYLTGGALDGTAGRFSEVEMDIFADSAKDVEISLLSRNINYQTIDNGRQTPESPEARLRIEWNDTSVSLSIYPLAMERRQKRGVAGARSPARARPEVVAALLAENS